MDTAMWWREHIIMTMGRLMKGSLLCIMVRPQASAPQPQPTVESNQASASLGWSVASAGDVNGDGYSDVVVGALYYDNGQTDEGAAFVYHGSTTGISTSAATMVESNQASANLGNSVASAGDVNGDGYSDVVVGAYFYDNGQTEEGAAFVYQGSATGVSTTASATVESNQTNSLMGGSVASAGDVNGDGYSDVVVGAYYYDNGQTDEGVVFVYHGSDTGISTSASAMVESNQGATFMGKSVSSAGDVNGDGYSDVVVGAFRYDNGQTDEGVAFVYHGSASGISTTAAATVESNQADAYLGYYVASAGDVNGDGYSDVVVGAYKYDNGQTDEGAAFVYHGSATGLDTTLAAKVESNQASSRFGLSVSSAGDVNGDGYSDVVVGAYAYDNGETDEGAAFVYHGSASGIKTTSAVRVESNQTTANLGRSVSSAGDVNGDGYSDVVVGAEQYDNGESNEGAAFVYHGSATGISTTAAAMVESNQPSANLGIFVSSAGDVNGDGYSDVVVGAYKYDNGQTDEGAAFVYHGSATGLDTTVAAKEESNQTGANLGSSVSSAGDVNGDGYCDVVVGASLYDNGHTDEGAAFVYHGSALGISTTASATLEGNQDSASMGYSVSSAGDVNGDGYSDVVVGAYFYDNGESNEGAAFIFHGSTSGLNPIAAANVESNQAEANLGYSVSSASDVNGDGYSDVVVGANNYDNGYPNEGAAFVYHGSAIGIDTTAAAIVESNQAMAYLGTFVSSAGDVNGDGYSDVIVGASFYDNGQGDEGAAFVYHGSASGISTTAAAMVESNQSSSSFGNSVASAGDVNGDGYGDVVVGAYRFDYGNTNEGVAFVYHGNAGGGLRRNLRAFNTGTTTPLSRSNFSSSQISAGLYAKSFVGRAKGKLVWETKHQGQTFTSNGSLANSQSFTDQSSSYSNLGATGTQLTQEMNKPGNQMKIRVRIKYDPVTAITGQLFSPWIYLPEYTSGFAEVVDNDLCKNTYALPNTLNATSTGAYSATDGSGWTHYCTSGNQLLLSLKIGSTGAVIPSDSITLKLGSSVTFSSSSNGGMITNTNGYAMIDRRWNVNPTTQPSSDSVGVRFYFLNSDYTALQTALANLTNPSTLSSVSQMSMYKATSGTAFANPHTVNGIVYQNALVSNDHKYWTAGTYHTNDHYAEFYVTSFSGGGGGGGGGAGPAPLPVRLLHFTGQSVGHDAALLWQTADEMNMMEYQLERLDKNGQWNPIHQIAARNQSGISNYQYLDKYIFQTQPGQTIYYRIKSISNSGETEVSPVVNLNQNQIPRLDIWMTEDQMVINHPMLSNSLITVMDMSGKEVLKTQLSAGNQSIIQNTLSSGCYILKCHEFCQKVIVP